MSTIAFYGCGGFGINAITQIINIPENAMGFPTVSRYALDTSTSNLEKTKKSSQVFSTYLIPNLDGGGKNQRYVYDHTADKMDEIMQALPPKDVNVVLFSLGGASGAICGALVLRELLKRGKTVFVICVGSNETELEAKNSYKTIGRLQAISASTQLPVLAAVHWMKNSSEWDKVNNEVGSSAKALALASGGEIKFLDSKDISNFANYHTVTDVPAQLTQLLIYLEFEGEDEELDYPASAISVLSLKANTNVLTPELNQPYGAFGIIPESMFEVSKDKEYSVHFVATNTTVPALIEHARKAMDDKTTAAKDLIKVKVPVITSDNGGDFVL